MARLLPGKCLQNPCGSGLVPLPSSKAAHTQASLWKGRARTNGFWDDFSEEPKRSLAPKLRENAWAALRASPGSQLKAPAESLPLTTLATAVAAWWSTGALAIANRARRPNAGQAEQDSKDAFALISGPVNMVPARTRTSKVWLR